MREETFGKRTGAKDWGGSLEIQKILINSLPPLLADKDWVDVHGGHRGQLDHPLLAGGGLSGGPLNTLKQEGLGKMSKTFKGGGVYI